MPWTKFLVVVHFRAPELVPVRLSTFNHLFSIDSLHVLSCWADPAMDRSETGARPVWAAVLDRMGGRPGFSPFVRY